MSNRTPNSVNPPHAYQWLSIHELDGSIRDRTERDDWQDEAEALKNAMKALETAPDNEFVVRVYNEMDERRLELLRRVEG